MVYRRRVVDDELDELLPDLAAVAIEGARGVGKTATAALRARTIIRFDDVRQLEIAAAYPDFLDRAAPPVLLDEWQRYPTVWDQVRRRVDAGAPPGTFLLTGSALPVDQPTHSGAGRIVPLRMRPFSLAERDLDTPSVSLGALLRGTRPPIGGTTGFALPGYVEEILASGFPGIRPLGPRARRTQLQAYITRIVERDFPDQGLRVRRPATLRAWLAAYAAATGTTASYNTILDAATAGESDKPAKTTTIAYRDVLDQLWLLDPLPGWIPGHSHLRRSTQAPRHHLVDPGLAASLLTVDAAALLRGQSPGPFIPRDGTLLGALFESLVAQSVRVYAQANEASVYHLRTEEGRHEVDLIVVGAAQRVVALEVKLSATVADDDVRHLLWLRQRLADELLDAAVITTGSHAYRRTDGIAVIPAALLGP